MKGSWTPQEIFANHLFGHRVQGYGTPAGQHRAIRPSCRRSAAECALPQQYPRASFASFQVSFKFPGKSQKFSLSEKISKRKGRTLGIVAKYLVATNST